MEYVVPFEKYQQGLKEGKFVGLQCNRCNEVIFPPTAVCLNCQATELKETQIKGEGTLRTFTVIRVAPEGRKPPYVVAMVELDEGPWVIGNLVDLNPDHADMSLIGKKVTLGSQVVKGDKYSADDTFVLTFTMLP